MKVTVYQDAGGKTYGFQVFGHSDLGQAGEDILCAAVSVLTTNCVNSIEAFTEDEPLYLAVNEEEGFLHFKLKTVSEKSELLLNSLVLGLKDIEASYGTYIQIQYEEE